MAFNVQVRYLAPRVEHRGLAWLWVALRVYVPLFVIGSFLVWSRFGRDEGFLSFVIWTPVLIVLMGGQLFLFLFLLRMFLFAQLRKGPAQVITHHRTVEVHTPEGSWTFYPKDLQVRQEDGSWHLANGALKVDVDESLVGRTDRRRLEAWAEGRRAPHFAWF